jgi:hypothetical protein
MIIRHSHHLHPHPCSSSLGPRDRTRERRGVGTRAAGVWTAAAEPVCFWRQPCREPCFFFFGLALHLCSSDFRGELADAERVHGLFVFRDARVALVFVRRQSVDQRGGGYRSRGPRTRARRPNPKGRTSPPRVEPQLHPSYRERPLKPERFVSCTARARRQPQAALRKARVVLLHDALVRLLRVRE